MPRTVKYTSESRGAVCKENLPGCDVKLGILQVCFEDGSGVMVCKNCFNRRHNKGEWVTDSTVIIKAA